jgi:hypothetical protein
MATMFAHDLHLILAAASVAAVLVAGVEAALRALVGRPGGRLASVASGLVLVLIGMTGAGGLAMLVQGARPRELLHYVYAMLAFGLIPVVDSMTARIEPRRRGLARLAAALVALVLIARLFATG